MLKRFEDSPKNLFIIDGLGALVSIFFLGVVLVHFESFFGIPAKVLYVLASVPVFFVVYDVCCYFWTEAAIFLKGIALLNTLYCFLSITLTLFHIEKITIFGWLYLVGEILILIGIITTQFKVASTMRPV